MKFDFKGQTVLITGGTRGIGKQMVDDFASLGARLIVTGTHEDQIGQLNRKAPSKIRYHAVDFINPNSTERFLNDLEGYKQIDVCINNAAINRLAEFGQISEEDWDDMQAVNVKAPFLLLSRLAAKMKKRKYGRIVNISSIFGLISRKKRVSYTMTKSAINGLTVAVSNELAGQNILVNTVSPGFILTDLTKKNLSPKERKELAKQIPAGRLGQPSDISKVVVFLASPLNTYLTGQNIVVDGGFLNV